MSDDTRVSILSTDEVVRRIGDRLRKVESKFEEEIGRLDERVSALRDRLGEIEDETPDSTLENPYFRLLLRWSEWEPRRCRKRFTNAGSTTISGFEIARGPTCQYSNRLMMETWSSRSVEIVEMALREAIGARNWMWAFGSRWGAIEEKPAFAWVRDCNEFKCYGEEIPLLLGEAYLEALAEDLT